MGEESGPGAGAGSPARSYPWVRVGSSARSQVYFGAGSGHLDQGWAVSRPVGTAVVLTPLVVESGFGGGSELAPILLWNSLVRGEATPPPWSTPRS